MGGAGEVLYGRFEGGRDGILRRRMFGRLARAGGASRLRFGGPSLLGRCSGGGSGLLSFVRGNPSFGWEVLSFRLSI